MIRATILGMGVVLFIGNQTLGQAAAGPTPAEPATGPTQQELLQQIEALRAKVNQLEAQQQKQAVDAQAVDATVERVLKDADRRSRMMMADMPLSSGWHDGKFMIRSDDGNFVLHPWFQFQLRQTTNWREDGKSDGNDDIQNGFELRRMKIGFDGNVFSPDTTYLFLWATNRKNGGLELEEAWVKHALNDKWSVMGGQFKDPFAHESLVSSKRLLAADRTLITDNFTGGDNFVQGVSAIYSNGAWKAAAAFHDGARNNFNQNFQDFPINNADWGAAARVEYKFSGDWKAYDDFTALKTKENLLVLGGGADITEAGSTQLLLHTVDLQFETPGGLSAYGAYLGRYITNGPVSATAAPADDDDLYDWGFVVQGAYLLKSNWEPFARYEYLHFDEAGLPAGSENDVHVIAAGANWYLRGHDAKFTFDLLYLPDGSPVADDGAGILANDGNSELIFRAQFQLLL